MKNQNQAIKPFYILIILPFLLGLLKTGFAQIEQDQPLRVSSNNIQNTTINETALRNLQLKQVPNLVGKPFNRDTIERILDGTSYFLGETKSEINNENNGFIIEQHIRTDLMLDGITPIDIVFGTTRVADNSNRGKLIPGLISRVPETLIQIRKVQVPPLQGETFNYNRIAELLKENSLQIGDTISIIDNQRQGLILRQYPPAGREVNTNTRVNIAFAVKAITAEQKPETIEVPNYIGSDITEVLNRLPNDSLRFGKRRDEPSEAPAGTITEQFPEPGMLIDPFTTISFKVSLGPPQNVSLTEVPDLYGFDLNKVARLLREYELFVGQINEEISFATEGTVIQQNPKAGVQVEKGTPVNIFISINENTEVVVPNVLNMEEKNAVLTIKKSGLVPVVIYQNIKEKQTGTVSKQNPVSETLVSIGTEVNIIVNRSESPINTILIWGGIAAAILLIGGVTIGRLKTGRNKENAVRKNANIKLKPVWDAGKQTIVKENSSLIQNKIHLKFIIDLGKQSIEPTQNKQ